MEFLRNIDATFVFCFPAISLRCSIRSCTFFCAPFVLSLLAYIFFLKRPCGHVSFWSFVLDKLPAE